jgi:hypothetical protein
VISPLRIVLALAILAAPLPSARAVLTNGTAVTVAPTDSNITNWTSGWGASGVTGWDFVGMVNGASGVYLRNGWVLTAAHVGAGGFTLGGIGYSAFSGTATSISDSNGVADLILFQVFGSPALPSLTIRSTDPVAATFGNNGSSVVMIGNGGGGKSWGVNTITDISIPISLSPYQSTDFATFTGTKTLGFGNHSRTLTNNASLTGGDPGGAGFIFNSTASRWELAGINEAIGSDSNGNNYSFLVQLSRYASLINSITSGTLSPVPEPRITGVAGAIAAVLAVLVRRRFRVRTNS